jgi:hypothetical protein
MPNELPDGGLRVPGCGRLARIVGITIAAILGFSAVVGAQGSGPRFSVGASLVLGISMFWIVRAVLLGVTISRTTVTVRAWLWTFHFPIEAIDEVGEQPYSGVVVTWGTRPRRLRELVITTKERKFAFPSTVASERSISQQLAFVSQNLRP